ncbi:phosphatase/phosphohexomutase [Acetobacter nitrogenifigens DSM 23921 = NBRC 105050]|uniref:Phosphatase n=1 Tax=Acetobacter nitrogenifigens DSM 23921 = NBRC 105050 TaxID=1120919 RepID=A0A511X704_9PROT|nr:HAD family phosphatase [Acetobacter nitrogenifigens]GBQ95127.1 phosphatase/phosphohexomutase [Acetobacter nitrogenifigens DSM 23921 = NBRC 105050]GEN58720.1 phosphatase [Acetobacter nitrogenifigens DSM 23921 = NBRC 105050]
MIEISGDVAALIFDCDGTLVDTLPLYLTAWRAAVLEVGGIDLPPEWFRGKGGYAERMLLAAVDKAFNVALDHDAVISAARRGVIDRLHAVRENTPVVALAREWRGRLPLAVASSGSREVVEASLAAIGLREAFAEVVTVEDVVNPKPDPEIYLLAAQGLGVDPGRCVVLEDSDEGLEAARAAGMRAFDVRGWAEDRAGGQAAV